MKKRQLGITVIETLGALAVASLLLLGLIRMMGDSVEDLKGQQAALYQAQLTNATRRYIEANFDKIKLSVKTKPVVSVSLAEIRSTGSSPSTLVTWLSENFADTNPYGQTPCILLRRSNTTLNPIYPDRINALVVTYGGQRIPEKDLAVVAMNAGQGGGYISTAQPGVAKGAGWSLDTAPYRTGSCGNGPVLTGDAVDGGHLVSMIFFDGPGQERADFLYRSDVPGHPELTTMNTPIRMAAYALKSAGTSCGTEAAIAIDATTRHLLICGTNQIWQAGGSSWKEPVGTFNDLPANDNLVGDVRMVTSIGRAFTFGGTRWIPLGIDENGNLDVPDKLLASSIESAGLVRANEVWSTNVYADNDVVALTVHGTKSVHGGYLRADRFTATNELVLIRRMNPGQACHIPSVEDGLPTFEMPIGTVLLDANGYPLICANDQVFRYANGTFSPN